MAAEIRKFPGGVHLPLVRGIAWGRKKRLECGDEYRIEGETGREP
jgi:hypothetical protein